MKIKKPKYNSSKAKKRLRSLADKLWFLKHKKESCEVCGKPAVQVHHYYFKGTYGHLRYDNDNGVSLCKGCHFVLHNQDSKKIEEKIIEKRGRKWYNKLRKKSQERDVNTQTIGYYKNIIIELNE